MNLNVQVPDPLAEFVEKEVEAGHFPSSNEVVTHALSLLKQSREPDGPFEGEELEFLRRAFEEGIASGDAGELDIEEVIAEARRQLEAGE